MVEDTISETILPPITKKNDMKKRKKLWITIGVILSVIVIAIVVIPTSIILTKKTDTTTSLLTTSVSVTTETITVITSEMTKTTISIPTTIPTVETTTITSETTTETKTTETTTETTTTTTTEIIITTTTTLITSPPVSQMFIHTTETVYGIWNTTAGGDSIPSEPGSGATGTYWYEDLPEVVLDRNVTTEYANHGMCPEESMDSLECGLNTGFYVRLGVKQFTLTGFRMATNKDFVGRDPLIITIEGSNFDESELTFGTSWTLIYNGITNLADNLERRTFGIFTPVLPSDPRPFKSYRVLATSKRGGSSCISYSEFEMYGYIEYN